MTTKAPNRTAQSVSTGLVQYQKALHRYLMQQLKSAEDAADLAQEVYLRMLRVESNELIRSPQDYLYGIASHVVCQFKIRARRDVVVFDSDAVEKAAENPEVPLENELAQRVELQQRLEWALKQLPTTQRIVFLLRKRDRLSDRQIAEALKLSTHTVKKYLFQAQARMRTLWNLEEDKT